MSAERKPTSSFTDRPSFFRILVNIKKQITLTIVKYTVESSGKNGK